VYRLCIKSYTNNRESFRNLFTIYLQNDKVNGQNTGHKYIDDCLLLERKVVWAGKLHADEALYFFTKNHVGD